MNKIRTIAVIDQIFLWNCIGGMNTNINRDLRESTQYLEMDKLIYRQAVVGLVNVL